MEPDKLTKQEDRRAEYATLRTEILQINNICLLMMGYLLTAVGFLYSASLEWLLSFLSFIGLCYFTDKRFSIRRIATFIANEMSKDDSGFEWEKYVQQLREEGTLSRLNILTPHSVEMIEMLTCLIIAFSPAVRGALVNLAQLSPSAVFWFIFAILTLALSVVNFIKYNRAERTRRSYQEQN